jgi:ubiquinone/menaquinone biosynthesis C-methylase UbiE
LISEEREARWKPREFLSRFHLPVDARVADLGCGPGFWTMPLAEIVGAHGVVWALDVSQDMLDALQARHPPPQVRLMRTELPHVDLPDAATDFIFAAFVLHEVPDLAVMSKELLRIGGRVAVLEWRPDAVSEAGPPRPERLWSQDLLAVLKSAGFRRAQQIWQDDDNYLIEAEK